jgi:uncharacterized protein affecting Mg2+/Co2+ transport
MVVTEQEHLDNIVTNAFYREKEVYAYQVNIDNYTQMLSLLPTDNWPVNLESFKNASIESLPLEMSQETVESIAKYQYRDKLLTLLRTEKVEQSKAQMVLDTLKNQIVGSGNNYTDLLASKKASEISNF